METVNPGVYDELRELGEQFMAQAAKLIEKSTAEGDQIPVSLGYVLSPLATVTK